MLIAARSRSRLASATNACASRCHGPCGRGVRASDASRSVISSSSRQTSPSASSATPGRREDPVAQRVDQRLAAVLLTPRRAHARTASKRTRATCPQRLADAAEAVVDGDRRAGAGQRQHRQTPHLEVLVQRARPRAVGVDGPAPPRAPPSRCARLATPRVERSGRRCAAARSFPRRAASLRLRRASDSSPRAAPMCGRRLLPETASRGPGAGTFRRPERFDVLVRQAAERPSDAPSAPSERRAAVPARQPPASASRTRAPAARARRPVRRPRVRGRSPSRRPRVVGASSGSSSGMTSRRSAGRARESARLRRAVRGAPTGTSRSARVAARSSSIARMVGRVTSRDPAGRRLCLVSNRDTQTPSASARRGPPPGRLSSPRLLPAAGDTPASASSGPCGYEICDVGDLAVGVA